MSEPAEIADEMNHHLDLPEHPEVDLLKRTPRAPNRRKFEEDLEALNATIRTKEAELHKLKTAGQSDREGAARPDLPSLRAEKEVSITRRRKIDTDLRCLNQDISKKMGDLTKVQSNLPYKKEEKINDAIRKLEQQLTKNNFKLSEEKKIVAEIDVLKRSKKALEQYITMKKEIDGMRDRQRRMREERDYYFKSINSLKQKEDEMRKSSQTGRLQASALKKAIDALYEEKRHLVADFKAQEKEYQALRDEVRRKQRLEEKRKKENERQAQQQELAEYVASREPYEEELHLCATLIAYLQPHLLASEVSPSNSFDQHNDSLEQADLGSSFEAEGMFLLKKKCDDNLFDGVVRNKANKRSKREKRKPANKPVTHTPEIFAQFAQLQLQAPSNVTEVAGSIQQLQTKKYEYECLASLSNPHIQVNRESNSDEISGSTGTASCTESGIPSMPSTPEVQLDCCPLRFPEDAQRRRLSGDSGLEDHGSCDELLTDESFRSDAVSTTLPLLAGCRIESELEANTNSSESSLDTVVAPSMESNVIEAVSSS